MKIDFFKKGDKKLMQIVMMKIDDLKPYQNNAKLHPAKQVNQIAESIKRFGMNDPIGIWGSENLIVEGHGRYLALKQLEVDEVPCIRLDHLTIDERKEYTLIHNKTTMNSGFDIDALDEEIRAIMESDKDIDLSEFDFDIPDMDEDMLEDDSFDPEPPEEPISQKGDIYQLGVHRLMCGDSTNMEDVKKLMDGNLADLVETDPPYNVAIENAKGLTIENDNMSEQDFSEFLIKAFKSMDSALKSGGGVLYLVRIQKRSSVHECA